MADAAVVELLGAQRPEVVLDALGGESGEVLQDGRTRDLVFPVPELIARLSAVLPLLPGDLVFTGTPAGVGQGRKPPRFLQPGDVLRSWIEGVGELRNAMVAAPVRAVRATADHTTATV